jgi:hypothetical protein
VTPNIQPTGPTQPYPPYAPQPKRKSRTGLIIATVALGLLACCGGGAVLVAVKGGGGNTTSGDKAATVGLNQAARDGKFEFVVTAVKCGEPSVGSGFLAKKAQGQFCIVSLSVRNIGDKPQTFFDNNQKAYAGQAEYATDSAATLAVAGDQPTWVNAVNPGNAIVGKIVFDVPAGATLDRLMLHDSAFSGGVTVKTG